MADPRVHHDLQQVWDAVLRGAPAAPGDLDPALTATIRRLRDLDRVEPPDPAFVKSVREELVQTALPPLAPAARVPVSANGRTMSPWSVFVPTLPGSRERRGWALAQFATAALVLITLAAIYFVLGPGRPDWAKRPAVQELAPAAGVRTEVVIDATLDALPGGYLAELAVRDRFKPGSTGYAIAPLDGPQVYAVVEGQVEATVGGTTRTLTPGDQIIVPADHEAAFRPNGPGETIIDDVLLIPSFQYWDDNFEIDSKNSTAVRAISALAPLPAGSARVVLTRHTVPPGAALPPIELGAFDWLGVVEGELALSLEGQEWPFTLQSEERATFLPGATLSLLQPGAQVTVRNAGPSQLVVFRLTITPATVTAEAPAPAPTPPPNAPEDPLQLRRTVAESPPQV